MLKHTMLLAQAKQKEEAELQQRAERIRRLEARRKQQEEAAAKTLWQQLQAHQVGRIAVDILDVSINIFSRF